MKAESQLLKLSILSCTLVENLKHQVIKYLVVFMVLEPSVVNALSKWMEVTIKRDGGEYFISFKNGGHLDKPLKKIGKTNKTGVKVRFMPDDEIFQTTTFSFSTICERMQESAFLLKNITINIYDEATDRKESYHYEKGLNSFAEYLNTDKKSSAQTI